MVSEEYVLHTFCFFVLHPLQAPLIRDGIAVFWYELLFVWISHLKKVDCRRGRWQVIGKP